MKLNRNHTIDVARGIAILFVIFGHICHVPVVRTYLWGFHIPLFFFISGLLFNKERYSSFADFVKRKAKRLLIPYVLFYLLTFVYWIAVERTVRGADIEPWTQIVGMFYGTYSLKWMFFNGALWFIPCLFTMEVLYWFIRDVKSPIARIAVLAGLYAVGCVLKDVTPRLPFGLCAALLAIIYYGMGDISKYVLSWNADSLKRRTVLAFSFLCLLFVQILLLPFTGADLAALYFVSVWTYVPIACIGIVAYCALSAVISKNRLLEWIGRNSLVLFALQEPVYRAVIFVCSKCVGQEPEFIRDNLLYCGLSTVVTVLVIVPFIYAYNKLNSKL